VISKSHLSINPTYSLQPSRGEIAGFGRNSHREIDALNEGYWAIQHIGVDYDFSWQIPSIARLLRNSGRHWQMVFRFDLDGARFSSNILLPGSYRFAFGGHTATSKIQPLTVLTDSLTWDATWRTNEQKGNKKGQLPLRTASR
jgi:hypothetical protein